MQVLETPDPQWVILSSVSTIIVDIVRRGQVHNWLQIIDFLIEKLNHHVNPPTRVKCELLGAIFDHKLTFFFSFTCVHLSLFVMLLHQNLI